MRGGGGGGVVADHDGGGADEGGVDGCEEVVAAGKGVAAGEARSGLAGGAAEEDVVEVGQGLGRAEAAGGGEDESEVGAVLSRAASEMLIFPSNLGDPAATASVEGSKEWSVRNKRYCAFHAIRRAHC
jgi:hypothetical protein